MGVWIVVVFEKWLERLRGGTRHKWYASFVIIFIPLLKATNAQSLVFVPLDVGMTLEK